MNAARTIDFGHPSFADFYDELPLWSAPFAQSLLERVPLKRGATIVDVGCGTGFLSVELAQRCGPDSRIYAVDPWVAAMDRLERKLDYLGVTNVELMRCDAAETGLPDSCADVIVSNLGINNFADPAKVLAECRRMLRPGGRLMLTTNLNGHMAEVYSAYRGVLDELGLQHCLPALSADETRRGTIESTRARLIEAGFGEPVHEVGSYRMRFADGTALLGHWFMQMAFVAGWRGLVPEQKAPAVIEALERRLNAVATERGELALTIPVAVFEATRP